MLLVQVLAFGFVTNHDLENRAQRYPPLLGEQRQEADGFLPISGRHGLVVLVAKVDLQPLAQSSFVLNDQNPAAPGFLGGILVLGCDCDGRGQP